MLRTLVALPLLCLGLAALPARAQKPKAEPRIAGDYQVKLTEVSNNCVDTGMSFKDTTVTLTQPGARRVEVSITMVPVMKGVVARGGKFKAEAKKGKTGIDGVDGRFSIAGRGASGGLQFLLIAEYFQGDKPLCTQSWNGAGQRR